MSDEVLKRNLRRAFIICAVVSLICVFINWRISTGVLLGFLATIIYAWLLEQSVDRQLNGEKGFSVLISKIVRLGILALALYVGLKYSGSFNVFGVFFGEMSLKISLLVFEGIIKK